MKKAATLVSIFAIVLIGTGPILGQQAVADSDLTVPDIIDILISLGNSQLWDKVPGNSVAQPFDLIKRRDATTVEYPYCFGLEWGPDNRTITALKITGPIVKMEVNTFCGPGNKAAYCHFGCLNEIEVVSRTHVRIKQTVSRTGSSPITPPVKDGTYFCEFRKKS